MRKKIKHTLTVLFSSMLLILALGVCVQAKERDAVTGIGQSSENPYTAEELKGQLYNTLKQTDILDDVTYDRFLDSGNAMMDHADAASVSWPSDIPKPSLYSSTNEYYHHNWYSRVDFIGFDLNFNRAIDPNSLFCYLINPFNDSATTIQIPYVDSKGKEQMGSGRVVEAKEIYASGYDVDAVIESFYNKFDTLYGNLLVYNEAFIVDNPEYFWSTGEINVVIPTIYITEYTDGSIELEGTAYLVLIQYDKDGKVIYDFREPYYQDMNRLFNTIVEMQNLTNTIVSRVSGQNVVEKVKYFHWYLTRANELNIYPEDTDHPDSYNCLAALRGTVGPNGPTEISYALAFKHLCNKANIRCTVVAGLIGPLDNKVSSFWNYVALKDPFASDAWYAVNAAMDDLTPAVTGKAVSGYESEMYFLTGMNTVVKMAGQDILFGLSHSEQNIFYTGFEYRNGPKLCAHEYIFPVSDIKLSATETNYMYGYMDAPVITAEAVLSAGETGKPSYAWVLIDPKGKETVLTGADTQIVFPEVTVPGTYRIRSVAAVNGITTSREININVTIFQDVNESHWFYNAVDWAMENGITYGLNNSTFGSATPCTRAQIVTFLWRAAGSPQPINTTNIFEDVTSDAYYYDAILWAVENGITSGYTATEFAPDNSCTRAEMVTFLWRAAGKAEVEDKEHPFEDVDEEGFYFDAMLWAIKEGVAAGYTETEFAPLKTVTRAETVTFLYRANGHPIA